MPNEFIKSIPSLSPILPPPHRPIFYLFIYLPLHNPTPRPAPLLLLKQAQYPAPRPSVACAGTTTESSGAVHRGVPEPRPPSNQSNPAHSYKMLEQAAQYSFGIPGEGGGSSND